MTYDEVKAFLDERPIRWTMLKALRHTAFIGTGRDMTHMVAEIARLMDVDVGSLSTPTISAQASLMKKRGILINKKRKSGGSIMVHGQSVELVKSYWHLTPMGAGMLTDHERTFESQGAKIDLAIDQLKRLRETIMHEARFEGGCITDTLMMKGCVSETAIDCIDATLTSLDPKYVVPGND